MSWKKEICGKCDYFWVPEIWKVNNAEHPLGESVNGKCLNLPPAASEVLPFVERWPSVSYCTRACGQFKLKED